MGSAGVGTAMCPKGSQNGQAVGRAPGIKTSGAGVQSTEEPLRCVRTCSADQGEGMHVGQKGSRTQGAGVLRQLWWFTLPSFMQEDRKEFSSDTHPPLITKSTDFWFCQGGRPTRLGLWQFSLIIC